MWYSLKSCRMWLWWDPSPSSFLFLPNQDHDWITMQSVKPSWLYTFTAQPCELPSLFVWISGRTQNYYTTIKRTVTCVAKIIWQEAEEWGWWTFPPAIPTLYIKTASVPVMYMKMCHLLTAGFTTWFYYTWSENRRFFVISCNIFSVLCPLKSRQTQWFLINGLYIKYLLWFSLT